jgi:hypothetical protein
MKKYTIIILIIVAVLIIGGLALYFLIPKEEQPSSQGQGSVFYSDPDWGFELSYPADWQVQPLPQGETMVSFGVIAPEKNDSGDTVAKLFVLAFKPLSSQVFENEMQNSIQQLQSMNIFISQSESTIGGYPAKELIYLDNPENPETKQLHYFIDRGDTWYQVLYAASSDKFDQYLPTAEDIIASFKITK